MSVDSEFMHQSDNVCLAAIIGTNNGEVVRETILACKRETANQIVDSLNWVDSTYKEDEWLGFELREFG